MHQHVLLLLLLAPGTATHQLVHPSMHVQLFTGMHMSVCAPHLHAVFSKYATIEARIALLTKLWLCMLVIWFKQRTISLSQLQLL